MTGTWRLLADTVTCSVVYIQPSEKASSSNEITPYDDRDINNLQFKKSTQRIELNNRQEYQLYKFLSDSSHFCSAISGSFALKGGFLISKRDKLIGKIRYGEPGGQWHFDHIGVTSYSGSTTLIGTKMEDILLSDIKRNTKNIK
jgi:hypothetical protein